MANKVAFTLLILTLVLTFLVIPIYTLAQSSSNFEIKSMTFRSSAGTDVYPGSRRAYLRVDVQYNGPSSAYSVAGLLSPPDGVTASYGYGLASPARDLNGTVKAVVEPGDVFYFEFYLDVDKNVRPGNYSVSLSISYRSNSSQYSENYTIEITIADYPELSFVAVEVSWSPGAYPGTTDTALRVTIRNVGQSDLRSAICRLELPEGMRPRNSTAQIGYIAVGDQATLQFTGIDISENVNPGKYTAILVVDGVAQTLDGVTYNASTNIPLTVEVNAITSDLYVLEPFSIQWGEARPTPSYPGSRYIALTVTFVNIGEYAATSLMARASSQFLNPIKPEDVYSASIYPGGSCSLTFYFDVREEAPQNFSVILSLEYWVNIGGGTLVKIRSQRDMQTYVEGYPGTDVFGLHVVSAGWLNNYNVFPNTENATYQVVVANRLPFQLRGIKALLTLPQGLRSDDGGSIATAYVSGPITSYSTATLSFRISVGAVDPGAYKATLTLDYVAESGGPGIRRIENHEVEIIIVSDSEAVELISASWLGSAAEPGTYGLVLRVDVRNNYVDSMSGVILELDLPQGLFFAIDNSSRVKVAPSSPELIQIAPQLSPQNLQTLISMIGPIASSPSSPQQYTRGATLSFLVPLNVLVNSTGTYVAIGNVSYVDSWGCVRKCRIEVPIVVIGSTKYIDVKILGLVSVKSRYTEAILVLRNLGSSPVYNVYVTIRSAQSIAPLQAATSAPLLIATPSTIYIDAMDPRVETEIPVTFAFNPVGYQSLTGATTVMNYGVVPLSISISYKDANGFSHNFETTVTIALEPFIDIVARDLRAEASQGTLDVSGTLINYGSATAYRVEVKAYAGGTSASSFIGDIDPGSQVVFRVRLRPSELVGEVAKLTICYYNIFNEYYQRELNVSIIQLQPKVEEKTTSVSPQISFFGLLAIMLVALFLVLVGLLIYRLYRSHMRKLRSEVIPQ